MNDLTRHELRHLNNVTVKAKLGDILQEMIENLDLPTTDVTPVNAVLATPGQLTIAVQPIAGDTMTIGTKVYTFVANGTESDDGDISVKTDLATAKAAIIAAINGTDSINDPHPAISAGTFTVNNLPINALAKGVSGNVATTETFDDVGNVFSAAAMTGGVDGTVGRKNSFASDASYLYVAIAENTVADTNWRRISLGSAY